MIVLSLLGGIRKMFDQENRLHAEPVQVLNSTSGKSSRVPTGMNISQPLLAPNRGTGLENSTTFPITKRSGAQSAFAPFTELILVSVFLLSLFLTGCTPSLHQAHLGPPETQPMVVISGSSTVSGDLVVDRIVGTARPPGPQGTGDNGGFGEREGLSGTEDKAFESTFHDRLIEFSQDSSVRERVRRVTDWLEFSRSNIALPRLTQGAIRFHSARNSGAKLARSEEELRSSFLQNREFALWRELLVDPVFDGALSAEDLAVVNLRLDKAAAALVAAEKPEDVQDVDLLILKD